MSFYRDNYLQSEDWKNLRAAVLSTRCPDHRCECCGKTSDSLDVHHLRYRRLFDVKEKDLRALCRTCHSALHTLVTEHPEWGELHAGRWFLAIQELQKTFHPIQIAWRHAHSRVKSAMRRFCTATPSDKIQEAGENLEKVLQAQFLVGWQLDEELAC